MSICIHAYIVDPPAFEHHLDQPLANILAAMAETADPAPRHFTVSKFAAGFHYSVLAPGHVCKHGPGNHSEHLTLDQIKTLPDLQQSVRDYLASSSSFDLAFFLRDLPLMGINDCAREVLAGVRRHWIGSLLQAAQTLWHETPRFHEFQNLMGRILRNHISALPLATPGPPPRPADFPILPALDDVHQLGILPPLHFQRLRELLNELTHNPIEFRDPLTLDPPPTSDDWNQWVRACISNLTRPLPEFSALTLITFTN